MSMYNLAGGIVWGFLATVIVYGITQLIIMIFVPRIFRYKVEELQWCFCLISGLVYGLHVFNGG